MTTTAPAQQWLSITDVAKQAGVSPSVLRIWEARYGWPAPRRSPSGYRRFTAFDLAQITQVVARVAAGASPADIIREGRPHLLPAVAKPDVPHLDLSALPRPTTADGIATQRQLILGIDRRHPGMIRAAVAQGSRLHPRERGPALLLVLDAVRRQWPDHAWLDQILEA